MGIFISLMNRAFAGVVIAKLPFQPASFLQSMTHYGLPGTDYTECSITFFFVLSNMSIGLYAKRILKLDGPSVISAMNPPKFSWQ